MAEQWQDPFMLRQHMAWNRIETAKWYVGIRDAACREAFRSLGEEPVLA